ncbi:hypothetical protein QFC21_001113 [Naganishia friedmannii]|uniref:Uncharacterized protein n=1 Tax=Naganishia friedmannii TaxID=89922 RepID=A0ACC2W888_9TREE|nr:hypothetical protein QFC21_001113 [Naganishia friedmannii]
MSALADLYSLIPPSQGFILGKDLLQVFTTYETRRGATLLQPAERNALQQFAEENADAEVDGDVLVQLIGQLLQLQASTAESDVAERGGSSEVDKGIENGDGLAKSTGRTTEQEDRQVSGRLTPRKADDIHVTETGAAAGTAPATPVISHIPRRKQFATPLTTSSSASTSTSTPMGTTSATSQEPREGSERRSRDVTSPFASSSLPPSSYIAPTTTHTPSHQGKQDHKRSGSDGRRVQGPTSNNSQSSTAHRGQTPKRASSALSSYASSSATPQTTTPKTAITTTTTTASTSSLLPTPGTSGIVRPRPPRAARTSTGAASISGIPGAGTNVSPASAALGRNERTSLSRNNESQRHTARTSSISSGGAGRETTAPLSTPASPDLPALMAVDSEVSMLDETSFVGFHQQEGSNESSTAVGDDSLVFGFGEVLDSGRGGGVLAYGYGHGHGSRLDRISTTSTNSLGPGSAQYDDLKRENAELLRRKQELTRQVQVIGAETEAQMADLQEALDGVKSELAAKKREEKDGRTREAQLGTQICTLELEMQHLQQQLSTARETHSTQQRMLQDANAESDRLREMLLSKEEDVAGLKLAIEGYEDEKRSWQDQVETLQATNATLQAGLQAAQEAARTLERRKAENQELQQTIKRLTHELDMIRTRQSGHGRAPTDVSEAGTAPDPTSRPGTVGKSLDDELGSRFTAHEGGDSDDDKPGKGKTVIRTVTYRTERVVRHTEPRRKGEADEADGDSEPEVSIVEEEVIREYADVGVETDPLPVTSGTPNSATTSTAIQTDETHHGALPPYSPRSDELTAAEEALAHAHPALDDISSGPIGLEQHRALASGYADICVGLGSRCTVFEEKLKFKQEEAMKYGEECRALTKSLGYLSTAVVVAGIAGYYLGGWRGYANENDFLRHFLHDHSLPYAHLYVQEFIPNTTVVKTLVGGVKQFTGRTPI